MIDDYLHKASSLIVNRLGESNISTWVIGKNDNWKQEVNIGKVNNQQFTGVPHARFIEMLTYKLSTLQRSRYNASNLLAISDHLRQIRE